MKTILIIIAGMGDLPDPKTLKETPLVVAHTPALDTLARRGDMTSFSSIVKSYPISHKNSLLSILGYDISRGEPDVEELMEFGLDNSSELTQFSSLRPFIIPGFSGHGVCVTTSAWVRGVAKCALLKPLDIYSPGSSDAEILETIAKLTIEAVPGNEFVFVYVDSPLKASLRGDYEAKVKALEIIDRHLIAPIADYVWKSELLLNLAITTDLITPWHRRRPTDIAIPLITYFNNNDREGDPEMGFTEVQAMLEERIYTSPNGLIRYLYNYYIDEESDLPF